MKIIEANLASKSEIDQFYAEQGYHSGWSDTERAFVCAVQNDLIGVVKVESIHNVNVLRGMYVHEAFQNQGIGTRLLKVIEPVLNEKTAYCMPLKQAAYFYQKIGFVVVPENSYPPFLIERCKKYRDVGYVIRTMCRQQIF